MYNLTEYVCWYGFPKVHIRGLVAIYENELKALPGRPTPLVKYHRKLKNPYFSRHLETWLEQFNNSSFIYKFYCISDLVIFVVMEGEKQWKSQCKNIIFYGAQYFGTHDSEDDDNKDEKYNYLYWWLLPFNGPQYGMPYSRRTVVNVVPQERRRVVNPQRGEM